MWHVVCGVAWAGRLIGMLQAPLSCSHLLYEYRARKGCASGRWTRFSTTRLLLASPESQGLDLVNIVRPPNGGSVDIWLYLVVRGVGLLARPRRSPLLDGLRQSFGVVKPSTSVSGEYLRVNVVARSFTLDRLETL